MVLQNATTASIDLASPEPGPTISNLCRTATKRSAAKTLLASPPPPPPALIRRFTFVRERYLALAACPLQPSDKPVAFWYITAFLAQPTHRIAATQKNRNDLRNTASSSASYSPTADIGTLPVLYLAKLDMGSFPGVAVSCAATAPR